MSSGIWVSTPNAGAVSDGGGSGCVSSNQDGRQQQNQRGYHQQPAQAERRRHVSSVAVRVAMAGMPGVRLGRPGDRSVMRRFVQGTNEVRGLGSVADDGRNRRG